MENDVSPGLTPAEIRQRRLYNQGLVQARFEKPEDVVSWLGAVQAQDYAGARWGLGQRLRSATDAGVDRAFAEGAILRTHVLRPTWHFVTPADIRWLLALTAPRVHAANAPLYRRLELDEATLARSNDLLGRAVEGGRHLTRDELRGVLERAGIAAGDGGRLAYLVMAAELDGIVCSGPRRGKQFTYALLDERASRATTLDRQAALAELARRFFTSRGPATVHDLAHWSGLTVTDARAGLEAVKDQLLGETVGRQELWFPPPSPPALAPGPPGYLLSLYDEYFIGYQDRSAIVSGDLAAALVAMGNALQNIIVLDGQVVGTWRRTLRRNAVQVQTSLVVPPGKAEQHAVAAAAGRYAEFLGLPLDLSGSVGPPGEPSMRL